ncbi:MAG: thermonuclease family protein [Rivularia sp. (in: cyanobacteria)]
MDLTELILILATVDGETIRAQNHQGEVATIKLACIHIPTQKSRRDQAFQRLKQLLAKNTPVVIRFADTYNDKILGEVFLDNQSINLQMVKEGKAVVDKLSVEQNCYESRIQFMVAFASAKQRGLGLWEKSRYVVGASKLANYS